MHILLRFLAVGTLAAGSLLYGSLLLGQAQAPGDLERTRAFPGAEGAGAWAKGGRGGSVYRVTNLKTSGPGSLADAVSQPHRIIVFDVSGTIDLGRDGKRGKLAIAQPHITIAGQTAPGEGICIKNGTLRIDASDVIVRYLRVRRGFIAKGDKGDAIEVKGKKDVLSDIILDHLSASWATDENLTATGKINRVTVQYCLIGEGLDYDNPTQTPTRHSEGSLFGSSVPDGRVSFHHLLYAHHRLRCPRTTGGLLDFRNSIVYNCSEFTSHTGGERVRLNLVNNYYKSGPSTPVKVGEAIFTFNHSPDSRLYAVGNFLLNNPQSSKDNWRAMRYEKGLTKDEKFQATNEFDVAPVTTQSALEAYERVLADAGATVPARDTVDLRLVTDVCNGTGRVIELETDLPVDQRWPVLQGLPPPVDSDGDGIPDYWEDQFGLNKKDADDSRRIAHGGYANIEHYVNNTDPQGGTTPIVAITAAVGRGTIDRPGAFRIVRTGSVAEPMTVRYTVTGDAVSGKDYAPLAGTIVIPKGEASASVAVVPLRGLGRSKTVVVSVDTGVAGYHVGCPRSAPVSIKE